MTAIKATDELKKLIVLTTKKKGGIKLIDLAVIVGNELDTKVTSKDLKPVIEEMFSAKEIDLVEYKTPATEGNKMFLVPTGTRVLHTEDDTETEEVVIQEEQEQLLPEDMITKWAVVNGDGVETFTDQEVALGSYIDAKGKASTQEEVKGVEMYGLIPIKLKFSTYLDLPTGTGSTESLDEIAAELADVPIAEVTKESADGSSSAGNTSDEEDDDPFKE